MIELKPCPFCGNAKIQMKKKKGRTFVNGLDEPIEQHKWYAQCTKCRARGSIASGKVNLYDNNTINTINTYFEVGEKNGKYIALSPEEEIFEYDIKENTRVYWSLGDSETVDFAIYDIKELRDDLIRANQFKRVEKIVNNMKDLKYL